MEDFSECSRKSLSLRQVWDALGFRTLLRTSVWKATCREACVAASGLLLSVAVGFPWGVTTRRKWKDSTASQGAVSPVFASMAARHFFPPLT